MDNYFVVNIKSCQLEREVDEFIKDCIIQFLEDNDIAYDDIDVHQSNLRYMRVLEAY